MDKPSGFSVCRRARPNGVPRRLRLHRAWNERSVDDGAGRKLWQALSRSTHLLTRRRKFRAAMMNGDTHAMRAVGQSGFGGHCLPAAQQQLRFAGPNVRCGLCATASSLNSKARLGPLRRHRRQQPLWRPPSDASGRFGLQGRTNSRRSPPQTEAQGLRTLVLLLAELPPRTSTNPSRRRGKAIRRRPTTSCCFPSGSDLGGMKKPFLVFGRGCGRCRCGVVDVQPTAQGLRAGRGGPNFGAEDLVAAFAEIRTTCSSMAGKGGRSHRDGSVVFDAGRGAEPRGGGHLRRGARPEVSPTGRVTLKGRLVGFDDLFGEVHRPRAPLKLTVSNHSIDTF